MSLTMVGGPLSGSPAGQLNVEVEGPRPILYLHPLDYRIRAIFQQVPVVDAQRPFLLHESGRLPVFYFSPDDVRRDLLEPSRREDGDVGTRQWYALRVGDRTAPDAAWSYVDTVEESAFVRELLAFSFNAIDEWFWEDEQLFGHPRDPFSRIDVLKTTRRVVVKLDGEVLADTQRSLVLFETGLPPRYYIPREDLRLELLEPSSLRTRCAYKGSASYWSVRVGERLEDDLVWSYPEPQHDAERIRDYLCFFNERVDLEVDGVAAERPRTQWSRDEAPAVH